ncbi:DUF6557 family protein [Marinoscillum furvescens]|uniref:Uncharacterized protein n=1 Tax=Marinoscillum furvescens DSM 4134 TaxID=1122208 RepID=A0A3D9L4L1_MARFU|nr:DUF6557 family protein [Marinoscillum furvescens]RED97880.1 hypothetical protein C7460_11121 [Marinoscillum furvescens DSM 4134]
MTLKDLINNHDFLSVKSELARLYTDEQEQLDAYGDVFSQLRVMPEALSDITIRLTEIIDEDESYINVDGYYTDGTVDELSGNDALALDFTPWSQWLGMKIDTCALRDFTELEIIAHCLYEMTFISFDQEEIQSKWDELKRTVDEYEKMLPEERQANTISLEDFLKEIDDEHEEDEN